MTADGPGDLVAVIEYRAGTEAATRGLPWCVVVRCPDGCQCPISGEQEVIYGFRDAFEAAAWRDRTAAEVAASEWGRE